MTTTSHTEPVFLMKRNLPPVDHSNRYTVLEICLAAEKESGPETILGAQEIHGLWRIYPLTRQARNTLLIEGMSIRGCLLQLHNKNPYIVKDQDGRENPATKLWLSDIPISCATSDIETALGRLGCQLRSPLIYEKTRNKDGKLTRFLTGRRFVYMSVPQTPLEKTLKIGSFTARVYHREQPKQKSMVCSRCLSEGHTVAGCVNDIRCSDCGKSGHKRSDPVCRAIDEVSSVCDMLDMPESVPVDKQKSESTGDVGTETDATSDDEVENPNVDVTRKPGTGHPTQTESPSDLPSQKEKNTNSTKNQKKKLSSRGRRHQLKKSKTQHTHLTFEPRSRSATPKRPHAEIGDSPDNQGSGKQAKVTDTFKPQEVSTKEKETTQATCI